MNWQDLYWYSAIELQSGQFTKQGELPYWTMALTREALDGIDLRGKRCLDIGAVDGFMAAMMMRRGAEKVVAVDCCDYSAQNNAVKSLLDIEYEYLPRVGTLKLVDRLIDRHKFGDRLFVEHGQQDNDFGYDVVVCSGVLYHVYSPLHLIGSLRTMVRPGGIVILETAFIPTDEWYMSYNYFGNGHYIYAYSDTWFLTPNLMDYFLRMFHLEPIDFIYRNGKAIDATRDVGRGAIVCRAVDHPLATEQEFQMQKGNLTFEFDELYKIELEGLKRRADVAYQSVSGRQIYRENFLDLLAMARDQRDLPVDMSRTVLGLNDYRG